ncbi:MAG: hypothetical protein NT062_11630 [Proteobacteria bacterium]|nr:hypothetical protein [Pseudomonadota bacterium]
MGPLPYPHRATFLAAQFDAAIDPDLAPILARLLGVIVFDHLVHHRVVTLGDDDERVTDAQGRMLDAAHPQIEDSVDWLFRIGRRHEILWFALEGENPETGDVPLVLHARRPDGSHPTWSARTGTSFGQQLSQCVAQWLTERRLPQVAPFADLGFATLRAAAAQLVKVDTSILQYGNHGKVPSAWLVPPPHLAVPYLRVLVELTHDSSFDDQVLALDPGNPVARRNRYVTGLGLNTIERRAILPVIEDAPMYAKPHLSVWGEPFASDRPLEGMGVRHQGIAASLMPANPYACHNYSLQLADAARREESFRWADRATVAAPHFGAAHLDCVRRLRQVGRPGQAFAEAQYRCREILDRAAAGKLSANDWQAPHHAALLIAFTYLDIGRLPEAIELAEAAMTKVPADAPTQEAFAWARKRIAHWKTDAGLLARAYAWESHHRSDPGRVLVGLTRGRLTDEEDAMMLIDALVTLGRDDQAEIAYWQCAGLDGQGILGDGKARLSAAKALILGGDLGEALEQIQIVQARRSQSRLEAEINRLLRLAAIRAPAEWDRVLERRLEVGAPRLARSAARDLADFVPHMDTAIVRQALGERARLALDPVAIADLIAAVPEAQATAATILARLAYPKDDSLRAADILAQEWWTVLVPPARDREAHAAGAMLALGVSLANYLVATSGPPTPIAGAYRHIATEALHLVRRSRYQIDSTATIALLRVVEGFAAAPEWLLDTWLLRIERALDLEAEHGAFLDGMLVGMPTVQRLLRGDERIGWELRLAHDLAVDPSQYEPAAMLFERCARATEAGGVALAWSSAAVAGAPASAQLDVHWLAATANPTSVGAPWLRVAQGLFDAGRSGDGFAAACRGVAATQTRDRKAAIAALAPSWKSAANATPLDDAQAFDAGLAAASEGNLPLAVQHLRWAAACDPGNAKRAQGLAVALARLGHGFEAIRVLAQHERTDAPRLIGRALLDAGRHVDATLMLRYASRRFRSADDWESLAFAASRADNDAVCAQAGRKALALGAKSPALIAALATALYHLGEFGDCETVAKQLIADGAAPEARIVGLHAMARALAGQGRHVDAHPYARATAELGPDDALAAELAETMDRIVAQLEPPIRPSAEHSMERRAYDDLEAGTFDSLVTAITSPSWGITRVALAACEFRRADEGGLAIAPRALDAAVAILGRTEGTTNPDAVLARIRALKVRDNAFIQIDPPPPLGTRATPEEFERAFTDRDRRPHRPSAIHSFAR